MNKTQEFINEFITNNIEICNEKETNKVLNEVIENLLEDKDDATEEETIVTLFMAMHQYFTLYDNLVNMVTDYAQKTDDNRLLYNTLIILVSLQGSEPNEEMVNLIESLRIEIEKEDAEFEEMIKNYKIDGKYLKDKEGNIIGILNERDIQRFGLLD